MWKKILIALSLTVALCVGAGYWFVGLIDKGRISEELALTLPTDLLYLKGAVHQRRGKILAVVTSTDKMGNSGKTTGYELTELSRAYYVFSANGYEVDIASPKGGKPPVVIDDDDMGEFDYAFLNDALAQSKVNNSLHLDQIIPADYQGVYFVGGKGAMFDFPDNPAIQDLIKYQYQAGNVVGAVCHGPAALVNVILDDGSALVQNKKVSAFTNAEELFLIPEAKEIFPFLLQSKLMEQGSAFAEGDKYLNQISHDGNLLTGQNPWSVWALVEAMITQLGHKPIFREISADEHSVDVLGIYARSGYNAANVKVHLLLTQQSTELNRNLILMHGIVAAMQWDLGKAIDLIRLTQQAKQLQTP